MGKETFNRMATVIWPSINNRPELDAEWRLRLGTDSYSHNSEGIHTVVGYTETSAWDLIAHAPEDVAIITTTDVLGVSSFAIHFEGVVHRANVVSNGALIMMFEGTERDDGVLDELGRLRQTRDAVVRFEERYNLRYRMGVGRIID